MSTDDLSQTSRSFYERSKTKLVASIVLGAACMMLLGFTSNSGEFGDCNIYGCHSYVPDSVITTLLHFCLFLFHSLCHTMVNPILLRFRIFLASKNLLPCFHTLPTFMLTSSVLLYYLQFAATLCQSNNLIPFLTFLSPNPLSGGQAASANYQASEAQSLGQDSNTVHEVSFYLYPFTN